MLLAISFSGFLVIFYNLFWNASDAALSWTKSTASSTFIFQSSKMPSGDVNGFPCYLFLLVHVVSNFSFIDFFSAVIASYKFRGIRLIFVLLIWCIANLFLSKSYS